jgi:glucose/arabinose dehydrogenase
VRRLLPAVAALALVAPATAGAARHLVRVGSFVTPVYVASTPSDPAAIYIVEQAGRILRLAGGKRSTLLDIRGDVMSGGEQGLLSVAFHPNYGKNRLFYVDYTAHDGDTIIAEYRVQAGGPIRTRTLVDLPDPAPNHNGGLLVFGPDGELWWGNGDGGGGGDTYKNGQRVDGQFAKLMRLDVNSPGASWQTWAIGLRNPWRFSFDRATGALYIGDVGQNAYEEIDYVANPVSRSRLDFGWNRYEGNATFDPSTELASGWAYVAPIEVYSHDSGCSVTGGYVYRGAKVPSAVGRYFYGDYCSGVVWSLRVENGKASGVAKEPYRVASLSSFGQDAHGELYLTSLDGSVYRLAG